MNKTFWFILIVVGAIFVIATYKNLHKEAPTINSSVSPKLQTSGPAEQVIYEHDVKG